MNDNFQNIIEKYHGKCIKTTKKKLYNKLVSARRVWAKNSNCTPEEIESLITGSLGNKCIYCNEGLDVKNMSLDHDTPTARGGDSSLNNLKIVCKRCNRRKGILTRSEYKILLEFIFRMKEEARKYILKKLSSRDY